HHYRGAYPAGSSGKSCNRTGPARLFKRSSPCPRLLQRGCRPPGGGPVRGLPSRTTQAATRTWAPVSPGGPPARPGVTLEHFYGVPAMKKVFTTGQVAKICKVAPRTVSKWFDSGRLRGYRIPGSQDRRIPREHLIKFLKEHGMPLGELEEEGLHKILIIGADKLFVDRVKELLPEDDDYKYELAHSGFEAGIQ